MISYIILVIALLVYAPPPLILLWFLVETSGLVAHFIDTGHKKRYN